MMIEENKNIIYAMILEIEQCADEIIEMVLQGFDSNTGKYINANSENLQRAKNLLYQADEVMQSIKNVLTNRIN